MGRLMADGPAATGRVRPFSFRCRHAVALAFLVSAILLAVGFVFAVPSPYSLDEAIYILMVDAAKAGRLTIENGYDLFRSGALRVRFLREGPLGLVPQYPSGYGFVALPFYLIGDVRGLVLLNLLAHLGVIAITYGLALRFALPHFWAAAAALIFGFATFASSYAYGIWPHALSTLFVVGSVALVLAAEGAQSRRQALGLTACAGLVAGLGILIRTDVILVVPPVLLWLAGRREEWTKAAAFGIGAVPGLAMSAWLNHLKFGSWLPLSYGGGGSSTVLATYLPLAAGMAILGLLFLLRSGPLRSRRLTFLTAAAGAAVVAAVTPFREAAMAVANGVYVLLFSFQAYSPNGWEAALFSRGADGHLLLLGQLKRALIEGLPYLGMLPLLLLDKDAGRRRKLGLLALVVLGWIAPFAFRNWHGGSAANMRYFLPVLPFLSIMTAVALSFLMERVELRRRHAVAVIAAAAVSAGLAAAVVFAGVFNKHGLALAAATTGAQLLAVATMIACGITVFAGVRLAARIAFALGVAGLAWSVVSATIYDLGVSQAFRRVNLVANAEAARLPDATLVITGRPFRFMPQFLRERSFVASPGEGFRADGAALVRTHVALGHEVYVELVVADRVLTALSSTEYRAVPVSFGDLHMLRLDPLARPRSRD